MMALLHAVRRWRLLSQLEQVDYQLTQIALQREQDRHEERLLFARRALLQSELGNT